MGKKQQNGDFMRIAVDLDGVVADFVNSFLLYVNRIYKSDYTKKDIYTFRLQEVFGISDSKTYFLVDHILKQDLPVIPGAKEGLQTFQEAGHEVIIFTARYSSLKEPTKKWLTMKELPYDRLIFKEDWERGKEFFDIVIDDSVKKITELIGYYKRAFLFSQPWNERTWNIDNNFERVYNWKEIVKRVEYYGIEEKTDELF